MRKIAAVAALLVASSAAFAEVAMHDIRWYSENPEARAATLRICRNDYSYARMLDCMNAEQADIGAHPRRRHVMTTEEMLNNPNYWAGNRIARLGALEECRTGTGLMTPSMCAAARSGAALDPVNAR